MLHYDLTDRIIGCAIEVHRALGPGLTEYSYQSAFALEMQARSIPFVAQPSFKVRYRDIAHLEPIFTKQVLTYLKVTELRVGLLLNFNVASMNESGIRRIVL